MKIFKILPLLSCLLIFSSTNIVYSQQYQHYEEETQEDSRSNVIYSNRNNSGNTQELEQQSELSVTKVMNANMYDYIFSILKDNMWFVIVVCVSVVFILYGVIFLISFILKSILKRFDNSEYIELGPLKFKNRNFVEKKPDVGGGTNTFNIDRFLSMLEMILESEISNMVSKTVDITNSIHSIETNYRQQCELIFNSTFSSIRNEYYMELLSYIVRITGFDNTTIHKTREYFFIDDFLKNIEITWMDHSKDIIERNGFVEIVDDTNKAKTYINELKELIYQAVDVKKLEVTIIRKIEFDEIVNKVTASIEFQLQNMFIRLGKLKQNILEKKNNKMEIIDRDVIVSIKTLLSEIKEKLISKKNDEHIEQTVD